MSSTCHSGSSSCSNPGYTAPAPEKPRPCGHNQWMKQTKKKGKLILKCLECACIWKIIPENHEKCKEFHKGVCSKEEECEHPHIHARQEYLDSIKQKNEVAAIKKVAKKKVREEEKEEEEATPISIGVCRASWRYEPYAYGVCATVYA